MKNHNLKPVLLAILVLLGIVVAGNFPPNSAGATPRTIHTCVTSNFSLLYKQNCPAGTDYSWSVSRPTEHDACMSRSTRQIGVTPAPPLCGDGNKRLTWGGYSPTKKYLTACVDRRTKKMYVAVRGQCGNRLRIRWVKSAPYLPVVDSTTTTEGPSCASGLGPCEVGDIGPGGGRIFYLDEAGDFLWNYLELAPSNWNGASELTGTWCNDTTNGYGAYALGIGSGETNFAIMVANCTGIAQTVDAYESTYLGQTYSDWFIPSADELLAAYTNLQPLGHWTGFEQVLYWTSSEFSAFPDNANVFHNTLHATMLTLKEYALGVIPVRAG